jgi:hypothetical protein
MVNAHPAHGGKLASMLNTKIEELIAILRKRIEGREHSIAAMKAKPKLVIDPDASEAIDRAHIDELEYAIEKLEQLLS